MEFQLVSQRVECYDANVGAPAEDGFSPVAVDLQQRDRCINKEGNYAVRYIEKSHPSS